MRRFTKTVAAVAALTMAMGMMVSAAGSSSTTNTIKSSSTSSESTTSTPVAYSNYVVYRNSTTTSSRAAVVKTGMGTFRVASDYKAVTDDGIIATAIAPDDEIAAAVTADLSGTIIGPIKVQFYRSGVAGQKDFGTFNMVVNVAAQYNGQTATVYIYYQDGTGTVLSATAANGRVIVPLTQGATVVVVF